MKKSSLMGASVVAAALLAAAPVVAPVASLATPGTQVVKAANPRPGEVQADTVQKIQQQATGTRLVDDPDGVTDETAVHGQVGHFGTQLSTYINSLTSTNFTNEDYPAKIGDSDGYVLYVSDRALKLGSGTTDAGVTGSNKTSDLLSYFFNGNDTVNLQTDLNAEAAKAMGYNIRFDYSNAINTKQYRITGTGSNDGASVANDLKTMGGTVTMTLTLRDSSGKSLGDVKSTVSYNAAKTSAAYVSYNKNLNASVGDSANQFKLINSFQNAGGSIKDQNGNDVLQAVINNGGVYVNAVRATNENGVGAGNANSPVGDIFKDQGTYYQHIGLDLNAGGIKVPDGDWAAAVKNGLISVNGEVPSLTNVDADAFMVTSASGAYIDGHKYDKGTLVLKRTINVGQAQGNFKSEKVNGIVTVNVNNGMAAQVYDENGKMVLGRALPNKSAWTTGEKRTYYKNGQVFYQVSTYEYVRAQDVTYSEPFQDSVVRGNVTITKYPDQVIATKNDDHYSIVYALDSDGNGFHMTSRALAGNTKWRNGAKAVVNGKTFYQISTNEWLNSDSLAD